MNPEESDIIRGKILSLDELPSFSEVEGLFSYLTQQGKEWGDFCCTDPQNIIYSAFNTEFVDGLAGVIRDLNIPSQEKIIEVGSGRGKLSLHLQRRGIPIIPTDEQDLNRYPLDFPDHVEKAENETAIEKYQPVLVLTTWPSKMSNVGYFSINFPSVKHYIEMSEGPAVIPGGLSGSHPAIYTWPDWNIKRLPELERYDISFLDGHHSNVYPIINGRTHKTNVTLFDKVS